MTCHRLGGGVIVCRMGFSRRARCTVGGCNRPHTRLCDHPMPGGRTCDLKLCDVHAGRRPDDPRTWDLCPFHAAHPRGWQLDLPIPGGGR